MENSSDSIALSSSNIFQDESVNGPQTEEKGIQVNLKKCSSSRGTNTCIKTTSVSCSIINMGLSIGTSTSPNKLNPELDEIIDFECDSSDVDSAEEESNEKLKSSEEEKMEKKKFKKYMVTRTIMSIENVPKLFLGIPKKSFFLAKLLADKAKLPINHIYIILKKIRLNYPFEILAIDFGLEAGSISRIFDKSLPVLASLMQEWIVWPDRKAIQKHLPIPFRARYGNVISIIDCLEIEIEKPSDPVHEALTWSEYYKYNSVKYLISYTPDGLVSFISKGFGGQTSYVDIVKNSGYLDKLVPDACVIAYRGFRHTYGLFQQKNCSLVWLSSLSAEAKSMNFESMKQAVKQSNNIAALRIHMERVIRRLQEFKMLLPHACIDRNDIPMLDFVIVVACGIINMQDQLIK